MTIIRYSWLEVKPQPGKPDIRPAILAPSISSIAVRKNYLLFFRLAREEIFQWASPLSYPLPILGMDPQAQPSRPEFCPVPPPPPPPPPPPLVLPRGGGGGVGGGGTQDVPSTPVSPASKLTGRTVGTGHKAQTLGTTRLLEVLRPPVHSDSYRPGWRHGVWM